MGSGGSNGTLDESLWQFENLFAAFIAMCKETDAYEWNIPDPSLPPHLHSVPFFLGEK